MPKDLSERGVATKIGEILKNVPCMKEPIIPELTFRPDFMVDLENRLTLVEVVSLRHTENVDWKTLRLIECLFEVKMFLGNNTVFDLVLLNADSWKPYCKELLQNFFDKILCPSDISRTSDFCVTPKEQNSRLWDLEREFENSRHKQFYHSFDESYLRRFQYQEIQEDELAAHLSRRLNALGLDVSRNYPIRNLKNYYLRREMNLKFIFDFFVHENKIVEIETFKKINNAVLQNLLIKSRLIRYQKDDSTIRQRALYKMVLIANGDIGGPTYDRMRYLRMLTLAGWDVYPISFLSHPRIGGILS